MLDNEPEGGERAGTQPAGDTAENAPSTPARRTRTTRRKAAPPAAQTGAPPEPGAVIEAGSAADARISASGADDPATGPGADEPAPKVTRRRRKPVAAEGDPSDPVALAVAPAADPSAEAPSVDAPAVEAPTAPPAKTTRARRKKATPAADP
ncbi:MAG TPA: ribonuclease E/G, partial [Catenuloplanes sp.]